MPARPAIATFWHRGTIVSWLPRVRADVAPFRSDRRWDFAMDREQLWSRIVAVEEYPRWWPWLRDFRPDGGFAPGARWRCAVAPPLPYVLRFEIDLDRVDPDGVDAVVTGDIRGTATLSVSPAPGGCSARLRSELEPAHPVLRQFGRVARPVIRWGHDWVLDEGRRQFVDRALGPGPDR